MGKKKKNAHIFLMDWSFYHYVVSFSIYGNFLWSPFYLILMQIFLLFI